MNVFYSKRLNAIKTRILCKKKQMSCTKLSYIGIQADLYIQGQEQGEGGGDRVVGMEGKAKSYLISGDVIRFRCGSGLWTVISHQCIKLSLECILLLC